MSFTLYSLQSPTLEEYVVYKLMQTLAGDVYHNKCIFIPSLGNYEMNYLTFMVVSVS